MRTNILRKFHWTNFGRKLTRGVVYSGTSLLRVLNIVILIELHVFFIVNCIRYFLQSMDFADRTCLHFARNLLKRLKMCIRPMRRFLQLRKSQLFFYYFCVVLVIAIKLLMNSYLRENQVLRCVEFSNPLSSCRCAESII